MAEKATTQPEQNDLDSAKLYLWVKSLEGKVNNLTREFDSVKNDFIKKNNEIRKEVKTLNDDLIEFKHQHEKTLEKMDLIIKELGQTAGIEELNTLKKYMDLWNPLNFVTQRDIERIIENKLASKKNQSEKEKVETSAPNDKHSPFR
ncbi:hypothetical protein COY27_02230 [Candidatus Woesearchaeota archaeon CG_4_10_14_0_2_um_filter_33_13]|nr:MAG: hypothetical protein COY27_02230 [Candidatus Woesearchaeota archaeon CG_4_10_14_0_2_um_filter_33_13]